MPLTLDLSKTPRVAVANILLPLLPGGILLLAFLFGVPSGQQYAAATVTWHTYQKVIVALFVSYVFGFSTVLLIDSLSATVCVIALSAFYQRFNLRAPWRETAWQKIVGAYLPSGLSPRETQSHQASETAGESAEEWVKNNEREWAFWHSALTHHLRPMVAERTNLTEYFMSTLTALGSVILFLLHLGAIAVTFLRVYGALLIVAGCVYKFGALATRMYMPNTVMAAELLRLINHLSTQAAGPQTTDKPPLPRPLDGPTSSGR